MQEFEIDVTRIHEWREKLRKSPEVLRKAKAAAFKRAAPRLKALIDSEIGGTGRLKSFQEAREGEKGGYAKVRPRAETFAESRGMRTFSSENGYPPRYAVGYITNAANSGHRFPGLGSGEGGTRRYRVTSGSVRGLHFYERAKDKAPVIARQAAEEILAEVVEELE